MKSSSQLGERDQRLHLGFSDSATLPELTLPELTELLLLLLLTSTETQIMKNQTIWIPRGISQQANGVTSLEMV